MSFLIYLKEKLYLGTTYALVMPHVVLYAVHVVINRLLEDNFQLYLYFFMRYMALKLNRLGVDIDDESTVVDENN